MSTLLIKELRERTGAGFLDCKKAIESSRGDIEKAIEWLQERGSAKAAKKAGSIAAEGVVQILTKKNVTVIFEINSQTDFVANNDQFGLIVQKIGDILMKGNFNTIEEANQLTSDDGKTILEICVEATSKIGEKIVLRRAEKIENTENQSVGFYVHVNKKIAALLLVEGEKKDASRNVAMHIASMNPQFLNESFVPKEQLIKMKEKISKSETLLSKPIKIRENIAKGMLKKKLSEITLLDQEFIMEKIPVSKYLSNNSLKAIRMIRYVVGEGIEKIEQDFAKEVAAQMSK